MELKEISIDRVCYFKIELWLEELNACLLAYLLVRQLGLALRRQ